ncbi:hypothetical protein DPEC_G00367920 [Dallia pectoralis]|nr:hypothetical protein DPEC_G00367920 [Dallia pectoralis]
MTLFLSTEYRDVRDLSGLRRWWAYVGAGLRRRAWTRGGRNVGTVPAHRQTKQSAVDISASRPSEHRVPVEPVDASTGQTSEHQCSVVPVPVEPVNAQAEIGAMKHLSQSVGCRVPVSGVPVGQ